MQQVELQSIEFISSFLSRKVRIDIYATHIDFAEDVVDLLLINDGQDLVTMQFDQILNCQKLSFPLFCIGIHADANRRQEYGVAGFPDYLGRGAKAGLYSRFIMEELIPFFKQKFIHLSIRKKYVAGFSLGGLMAFDLLMDYPYEFSAVGVFSGSFWWRSKALENGYVEERDRIMHAKIRHKSYVNHLRFFIQTGQLEETADRNKNGIIDSIDDSQDIIKELALLGYLPKRDITYVELTDGRHDILTWARVMPLFLEWLH